MRSVPIAQSASSDRMPEALIPRFFIDFDDGDHTVRDEEGRCFLSEEEAIATAVMGFTKSIQSGPRLVEARYYRMTIRNEGGEVVFETGVTARAQPSH